MVVNDRRARPIDGLRRKIRVIRGYMNRLRKIRVIRGYMNRLRKIRVIRVIRGYMNVCVEKSCNSWLKRKGGQL